MKLCALTRRECEEVGLSITVAETWRQVWGDGNFFRGPRFLNDVFPEKISIFTPKISDDLLLVTDQVFQILRFFTVLHVVYDPFFTRKTKEKPLFKKIIP